jgi:hypothetical protein
MSWWVIALWSTVALVAIGTLAVAAFAALILLVMRHERDEPAAAGDDLGADILADGIPAVQRSRLWPPACRLREDYIAEAEAAFDWAAAETAPTRKPVR